MFVVPSAPVSLKACKNYVDTTTFCFTWEKPSGGNAVSYYKLKYKRQVDKSEEIIYRIHNSDSVFFTETVKYLQPGEKINANVTAHNDAGPSNPSVLYYASCKFAFLTHRWTVILFYLPSLGLID